jgi:hypothetical protein
MANNIDNEQAQETSCAIKLQSLTTWDDGKRITRVALLIADDADCSKRTEWLDAQISVELPITRNGALLREEVLTLLRDKLGKLAADYGRLVRP